MTISKSCLLIFATIVLSLSIDPQLPKHVIQVFGNATLGYYYINLYVGTPPQEQSVIIDTGSGQLAMPCSRCVSCGNSHIHKPFDLRGSSSSKVLTCNSGNELCRQRCTQSSPDACTFMISYAEGSSLSGILIQDAIQFQKNSKGEAITTTFGCTVRETNLFYTQAANGIFGLAPQRKARLLEKLYEIHSRFTGEEFLFSMCLAKNGGQLAIGKVDKQITKDVKPVIASFSADRNLYTLEGVGVIRIGETVLREAGSLGYYGLFIDSGSTFTYLPHKQHTMFLQQIENSCALRPQKCKIAKGRSMQCVKLQVGPQQTLREVLIAIFPSLDISVNGETVKWMPDRYFLLRNRHTGQACLGVESLDRFLLGANWMVDRNIVFNLKEKKLEIYSGVNCVPSNDRQDLPIYMDDTGSLSYISAVLKMDENVLSKLLVLVLIAISFVGVLLCIGMYCFKPKSPASGRGKKQEGEEEHIYITEGHHGNSHRALEEQSSEIVHTGNEDAGKRDKVPTYSENIE